MTRRRYGYSHATEPLGCSCEPGANAHTQHAKPGKKAADHFNPACPHSQLAPTTQPAPRRTTRRKQPRIDFGDFSTL